ncbi:hypothetical protein LINGRAPRIM_LOCUS220 [Linum grandiflorum]
MLLFSQLPSDDPSPPANLPRRRNHSGDPHHLSLPPNLPKTIPFLHFYQKSENLHFCSLG